MNVRISLPKIFRFPASYYTPALSSVNCGMVVIDIMSTVTKNILTSPEVSDYFLCV